MKKHIYLLTAVAVALCLTPACGHYEGDGHDHGGENAEEEGHGHGEDEIIFTPEQAKAAGLATEKIQPLPFEHTIKVSGRIEAASGDQRTITATVSGILSVVGQPLTDGMPVRAGQAMYSISSKGMEQSDASVALKIRYDATKREYERAKSLVEDKIITQSEFTAIESAYRSAAADLSTMSNRAAGGNVSISSPISGYLIEQMVQPGQFVQAGTPLAVVSQNRKLQLRADVPRQYASMISEVVSANFTIPGDSRSFSLAGMNGHKVSSGKSAETGAGYIPVIFEFDNSSGIVPGTFVETYLLSGNKSDAITVPLSALTEEQGLYFVYIRVDDHAYRKQEVTIGNSNGQRIEVLSGVNPGDEVVTAAAGHLKLAANSGKVPEGHSHNH